MTNGYYWIRILGNTNTVMGLYEPEWESDMHPWQVMGSEVCYQETEVEVIGPVVPMPDYLGDVKRFHETFRHPVANRVLIPDRDVRNLRRKLIQEEAAELAAAIINNDLPGIADGIADVLYVVFGAALVYGIPLPEVWEAVQTSNMAKLGPDGKPLYHDNGKVKKPEGWKAPDLAAIVLRNVVQCPKCDSYCCEIDTRTINSCNLSGSNSVSPIVVTDLLCLDCKEISRVENPKL